MRKIVCIFLLMFGIFNVFAKEKLLNKKEKNLIISALLSINETYSIKTANDESYESIVTINDILEDLDIINVTKENELYFIHAFDCDDNVILKLKNNKLIEIQHKDDYSTSIISLSEKTNDTIRVKLIEDDKFYEYWFDENTKNLIKSNFNNEIIDEYDDFNQLVNRKSKYEYENETLDCEEWFTYQNKNLIYVKGTVYDSTIWWEYYYDYDEFNRIICERRMKNNECYITEYKYDKIGNIIEESTINDSDSILIKYEHDKNGFVINVKFTINGDSSWNYPINGYIFEINSNCEYNIEKLSETQIKVIPTNSKDWFILNKEL